MTERAPYWVGGILALLLLLTWHNIGRNAASIDELRRDLFMLEAGIETQIGVAVADELEAQGWSIERELEAAREWVAILEQLREVSERDP